MTVKDPFHGTSVSISQHPNDEVETSISEYGKLRPETNKVDFLTCLEPCGESKYVLPKFTCYNHQFMSL